MRPSDVPDLRDLELFREMSEERFEDLMHGAYVQTFPPMVDLITEGDMSDFLHVVLEGRVELFASWNGHETTIATVEPIATFKEHEGLTVVISKQTADAEGMQYDGVFKQITLTVHSSLNAVGLTAAVATKLAEKGLSANVIAAFYHDHIFVQTDVADKALAALNEFTQ